MNLNRYPRSIAILICFSIILLGYAIVLSLGSIADFPGSMQNGMQFPFLSDKPVGEDGFYMLTVAYNLALGKGIAYNFQIQTSGIQPLATLLFAMLAKINMLLGGNKWSFVRVVIVFTSLVHVLLAWLVGLLSMAMANRVDRGGMGGHSNVLLLGGGLALFCMGLFRLSTYGLETPFYLSSLAITVIVILRSESRIAAGDINVSWIIGLLTGISILARIDAIVLWGIFHISLFLKKKIALNSIAIITAAAALVSLPWFGYVYFVTGSIMPSSGGAQSSLITASSFWPRLNAFTQAIISHISILLAPGRNYLVVGSLVLITLTFIFVARRKRARKSFEAICADPIFSSFAISVMALCIVYPLAFWASHFYHRYTSPLMLVIVPVLSTAVTSCIGKRQILAILLFSATLFAGQLFGSFHSGTIGNSHSVTAGYVAKYFQDPKFRVGAFQSGVIGYFNENTINLDGKLDPAALKALRNDSIHKYAIARDVNVIVDWKDLVRHIQNQLTSDGAITWTECPEEINNGASICILEN